MHEHFAGGGIALAAEHLHQLALAVAGDAGDADDLAGAHGKVHAAQRRETLVVIGGKPARLEADLAGASPGCARPCA